MKKRPEKPSVDAKMLKEAKKVMAKKLKQKKAAEKAGKTIGKVSPAKFNKGLKAAAAAGKLDKNPKFKKAVMDSPAKMKKMKDSAMKMKKAAMMMKKESAMKLKKSMATLKKASAMKMKKSAMMMKKAATMMKKASAMKMKMKKR
tara:strand:- start:9 stop:443 length:435 start_codon:yes stop_codon:yes gene_type:complete